MYKNKNYKPSGFTNPPPTSTVAFQISRAGVRLQNMRYILNFYTQIRRLNLCICGILNTGYIIFCSRRGPSSGRLPAGETPVRK